MRLNLLITFAFISITTITFITLSTEIDKSDVAEINKSSSVNSIYKALSLRVAPSHLADYSREELNKLNKSITVVKRITSRIKDVSARRSSLYKEVKGVTNVRGESAHIYSILDEINDLDQEKIELNEELINNLKMVTENEK